tara:strand:+ start:1100 stop:1279 length:180 start_codon:yes stop_codon:yes gene_type:complete
MKVGDLVMIKNCQGMNGVALVFNVVKTTAGTGQIALLSKGRKCSIPLLKQDQYLELLER